MNTCTHMRTVANLATVMNNMPTQKRSNTAPLSISNKTVNLIHLFSTGGYHKISLFSEKLVSYMATFIKHHTILMAM